jgi:two-component system OmpR family sensor kinase
MVARGISLRAKVTGVTVAVLAIGLVAVGIGTAVFLRNAQIAERDKSISQTVTLDQASSLLNVEVVDGVAQFGPPATAPLTSFYIAVYGPDGTLLRPPGPPAAQPGANRTTTFGLDSARCRAQLPSTSLSRRRQDDLPRGRRHPAAAGAQQSTCSCSHRR